MQKFNPALHCQGTNLKKNYVETDKIDLQCHTQHCSNILQCQDTRTKYLNLEIRQHGTTALQTQRRVATT